MKFSRLILILLFACSFVSSSFVSSEKENATFKLIFFEGSDWCINCIRFEQQVLSEAAFETFASKHSIEIERIDFPQRKQLDKETKAYNISMAEKYNFQGVFPTILLVHLESESVVEINYKGQEFNQFIAVLTAKFEEFQ